MKRFIASLLIRIPNHESIAIADSLDLAADAQFLQISAKAIRHRGQQRSVLQCSRPDIRKDRTLEASIMEPTEHQLDVPQINTEIQSPTLELDVALFVGKNAKYYAYKWSFLNKRGQPRCTWNGAAFVIGPIWLVYRKMYWQAGALFAAAVLLRLAVGSLGDGAGGFVSYAISFTLGLSGNLLYREHVLRSIGKLRNQGSSGSALEYELCRKGGTNAAAAWMLALLMIVVLGIALFG
ncbi:DUF2628 domain-containing protein [Caballeronia sp. ATUFL_F1_KS4A]|uniref:DUF2628 domain-containing protein n=1 Tax=Caballeronia sp. ATUFL_F1_KS4A TaxID=2921768 RepID=UPI002027FE7C|nr:DUF2628 domain-containing protein [Caballeronia sp. ATUFL_F1_KS4A]